MAHAPAVAARHASALRVGDLVAATPVRPVVRLADLDDPDLAPGLGSAFVLTGDAEHALAAVAADMRAGRGRGYLLEGNYGAGKSHLMAVLLGMAAASGGRPGVAAATGAAAVPAHLAPPAGLRLLPVAVPLLDHAARQPLEDVVGGRIAAALGAPAQPLPGVRRDAFDGWAALARQRGFGGLLLCVDEVSEFLRAKPDNRSLAEDARLLQFLAEWAEAVPAWVVLGVQEAPEDAGPLPGAVGGGLRDRYGVRFRLGAEHVRGLIARRLIRRLPGAEQRLDEIGAAAQRTFGAAPGGSIEAFARCYPVHPLTVELLDRLKPLFSQRRGVVDFISARLAGDPARRIPSWLDQPAERLVCPDALVDHFRDRARERPETAPLITRALEHFEHDLTRLLPDREQAAFALRLGKLLIAGALCPTPVGFAADEVALALLHPFTTLDPALNVEFAAAVADAMVAGGAYVRRSEPAPLPAVPRGEGPPDRAAEPAGAAGGGLPSSRRARYFCDLRADVGPVLRARLERWRSALGPDDARLWTALLPWCDEPDLPLHRLAAGGGLGAWDVLWRGTPRKIVTWLPAEPGVELAGPERLRDLVRRLELGDPDGLLILALGPAAPSPPPEAAPSAAPAAADLRTQWREILAPAARALHPDVAALLWLSRPPTPAESNARMQWTAEALLQGELAGDSSESGARLARHLRASEAERRRRAAALHAALFLEGEVFDAHGNAARPVDMGGGVPFSARLERLFEAPLERRFPAHPQLPVGAAAVGEAALARAAAHLTRADGAGPTPDAETCAALDRVLLPLGLCVRDARGHRLREDLPAGEHAARLLHLLAAHGASPRAPVALADARLHLRKGPGGLGGPLFDALCLTLVRTGVVSAVRGQRRLPPSQVAGAEQLRAADGLCPGALLPSDLRSAFRSAPILSEGLRERPLTHGVQRQAWEEAIAWRRRWTGVLPEMAARAERLRALPALRSVLTAERLETPRRMAGLVAAVSPGLGPADGLARILRALAAEPSAARILQEVEQLRTFLQERAEPCLEMRSYLEAPEFAPFPDVAAEAASVLRRLSDPEEVLGARFGELATRFAALRQAYVDAYRAAHDSAVGPHALEAHRAALGGPGARLARLLADRGIRPVETATLERAAAAVVGAGCAVEPGALEERLRRVPACVCGFRPGVLAAVASPAALEALAAAAAAAALETVQARLAAAAAAGDRGALELAALAPSAQGSAAAALACLPSVGEAWWSGQAPAVRQLSALESALAGRSWTAADLLSAVSAWIAGAEAVHVASPPGAWAADAARRWDEARRALQSAAQRPPASPGEWEAVWLSPAGCWARRLEEAADMAAAGADGSGAGPAWRAEAGIWASRCDAAFRRDLPGWGAARTGLAVVGAALDAAPRSGGAVFAFCIDALRPDLLEALLDEVAASGVHKVPVARGLSWAVAPTLTASQFEAWAAAGWDVQLARQDARTAAALAAAGRPALVRAAWSTGRCVCKWDFLDARLHAGDSGDYGTLCAEFRVRARRWLLPALAALGPADRAVVFGDHGFACRPDGSYAHGGDSLDEVLTPWCVLE